MKWKVDSTSDADDELTTIYMNDVDKDGITLASARIERDLSIDPDKKGEDFYGDRIYEYGPLAVVYELRPDDRTVVIIQVMRIKG
jgi:hypothetical protein